FVISFLSRNRGLSPKQIPPNSAVPSPSLRGRGGVDPRRDLSESDHLLVPREAGEDLEARLRLGTLPRLLRDHAVDELAELRPDLAREDGVEAARRRLEVEADRLREARRRERVAA